MKAKKILLVLLISFSLVACSSFKIEVITPAPVASAAPTSTPWAAETEMALASPTAPLEVTQVAMEKPTDFSPILYGGNMYGTPFFFLLGGAGRDAWLTPEESVARFSGEVTYSLSSMTQEAKYFLWGKSPELSLTCKAYTISTDAGLDEAGFVGVVDGWAITKREVTELAPEGEFYQQAVLDWLSGEGVTDPQLGTLQIFRVDLEGDGSDEIFISASHLDGTQHTTKAGDYSIILMRKIIGNDVLTKLVLGEVYGSKEPELTFPRTYSLANFIDLNQDGVLEVVVSFEKWEGFGAMVYQVDGQDIAWVLGAGC
jgi:hypothetical protein